MNKLYTSMLLSLLATTMPAHQMSADAAPTTTKSKPGSSQMDTKLALKVAAVVTVVAIGGAGYFVYQQGKKIQQRPKHPQNIHSGSESHKNADTIKSSILNENLSATQWDSE